MKKKQTIVCDNTLGKALLTNPVTGELAWTKYIKEKPSAKQLAFCMLPHREALFGGAAGGGKSSALLMCALQFVDVPKYNAIIFRKSLADLERAEGLLDRAWDWLSPWINAGEVAYDASTHRFLFAEGGSLTFGFIGSATAWEHYQGGAYQNVMWDELTQHSERYYNEMKGRLRRGLCNSHEGRTVNGHLDPLPFDPECPSCQEYRLVSRVPLRIRSTSNPGGQGAQWVKKHFKLKRTKDTKYIASTRGITEEQAALYVKGGGTGWEGGDPTKPYIPSFYTDNPGLDHEAYKTSLADITDEERFAELAKGDWEYTNNGRFKKQWFVRRYRLVGGYVRVLAEDGKDQYSFHVNQLRKYIIVDVAASEREGVAGESFMVTTSGAQTLPASWTCIGTFGITPKQDLLILDVESFQKEVPEIFDHLKEACRKWRPMHVGIDAKGLGKAVAQMALQMGIPVQEILVHHSKIQNSYEAQLRCRQGKVIIPSEDTSLWDVEEWLDLITAWRGFKDERDDEIDVLSNACHHFTMVGGNMDLDYSLMLHANDLPIVSDHNRLRIDFDPSQAAFDSW